MALTDTEKAETRRWVGMPDINRQVDLRLEGAMDALSSEGEVSVRALLVQLAGVDAQLLDARDCRLKVKSVEDIVLGGEDEIRLLWTEGNRLAYHLGNALDFRLRRRPFSATSGGPMVMGRG